MNATCREKVSAVYVELTEFAEHEIRALVRKGTPEAKSMALGVWRLWYSITAGFQADGDTERLEALFANGSPFDHQPSEN